MRPPLGIDRHQRRLRKALVEVVDDDSGVIDRQLPIHERRQRVVRVQQLNIGRKIAVSHLNNSHTDVLFRYNYSNPVTMKIYGT